MNAAATKNIEQPMGSLLYLVSLAFQAGGCIILPTRLDCVVFYYRNIIHVSSLRVRSQMHLHLHSPPTRSVVSPVHPGRQKGIDRQFTFVVGNRLIYLTLVNFPNNS